MADAIIMSENMCAKRIHNNIESRIRTGHRVFTNTVSHERITEKISKKRITANNRVIMPGIRIVQFSRILSNNHTIRGFFSNTSRILINNRNICISPVPEYSYLLKKCCFLKPFPYKCNERTCSKGASLLK